MSRFEDCGPSLTLGGKHRGMGAESMSSLLSSTQIHTWHVGTQHTQRTELGPAGESYTSFGVLWGTS